MGRTLVVDLDGEARLIGKSFQLCLCPEITDFYQLLDQDQNLNFVDLPTNRIDVGPYSSRSEWLRLKIDNPTDSVISRTILVAHNSSRYWELYSFEFGTWNLQESGYSRGGRSFYPHFSTRLQPGINTFYLRYSSKSIHKFDVWFGTEEKVSNVTQLQLQYASSSIAIALLITLTSIAVAVFLKYSLFYYYAFFTLSAVIFMVVSSNISIIYDFNLFSVTGLSVVQVLGICMGLELISTLLFISQFLRLKENAPELFKIIYPFALFALGFLLFQVATAYYNAWMQTLIILGHCILITGIFIYGMKIGIENARRGMFSWGIYVIGISVTAIMMTGRYRLHALNISWATMNLEMLLFGAMGLRDLYYRQLKMSQDINHSYEQLQKLVYPQQLSQMKEGQFLEQTMPVERSDSVIISFDIINSTSLSQDVQHEFFEDFFVQCQLLMSKGVEVDGVPVKLFRVKEMGDGFISSVGFPFPCEVNKVQVALEFIDEVTNLFYQNADKHLRGQACGFGVGIAGGEVGGYFPRSGIMQYDLYGMPVVLATRYEAMRAQFKSRMEKDQSIVIVQNSIFDKLPFEIKSRFTRFELSDQSLKVRDEPDAKYLWYKLVDRVGPQDLKKIS